jgi:hypothetical protein
VISKPVIESELLEVLARSLQLEWVHEAPAADRALPRDLPVPRMLPAELRPPLRQLARLGHVRALTRRLAAIAADHPALAPACDELRRMVDCFDFDALLDRLAEPADA